MPTIYIDNQPYDYEGEGKNLLEVCLSLGFNLPYFCWHPAMHSVGACRQCAVKLFKDAEDRKGRIIMSCMTPVADGMRLSIDDPEAAGFRTGVIEWLMINHPHDCPVCDEGGECHLQDMTVMTGHTARRYRFRKRSYRNQDLGPFILHEMNRCIQCYRCVRFYRDYAGGRDFNVFGWHDGVYFGRHEDGTLESEFSGNLVEVCPTGVFTDKTQHSHYVRSWDLATAPSVCVHCGLGCNTIPGERYGLLRRIRNRYHHQVNGYFLCDRGRYGYEFVNAPERLRVPLLKDGETQRPVDAATAKTRLTELAQPGRTIGIGSPRASLEANFALRELVGKDRFYTGLSARDTEVMRLVVEILRTTPARLATQQDIAHADAVFVLGEDVSNTAPMLAYQIRQAAMVTPREELLPALRIPPYDEYPARQAIQDTRGSIFQAVAHPTRLDETCTATIIGTPDDLARLGCAVAHALDATAPAVPDITAEQAEQVERIAAALRAAKRPVVISGAGLRSSAVLHAAADVARALAKITDAAQVLAVPECNSLGLALLEDGYLEQAVEAAAGQTVIVLEQDLPSAVADTLFAQADAVVALDHLPSEITARADLVLPATTFAEGDGTLVNHEGRAQRFFQVFVPEGDIQESWRWLGPWEALDGVLQALVDALPALALVRDAAPGAEFRMLGQKIARKSPRVTGRTAITAHLSVHEPAPPADPDAPMTFSMEGYGGQPPAPLLSRYWAPGWNSVQGLHKFQQEVGGPLRGGDPDVHLISRVKGGHYYGDFPAAFVAQPGNWLLLPAYQIFGSEPLSAQCPGIAQRISAPFAVLHPDDAARLGVDEGQSVIITIEGQHRALPVRLSPAQMPGTALLPAGPDTPLPAWGALRADVPEQEAAP